MIPDIAAEAGNTHAFQQTLQVPVKPALHLELDLSLYDTAIGLTPEVKLEDESAAAVQLTMEIEGAGAFTVI